MNCSAFGYSPDLGFSGAAYVAMSKLLKHSGNASIVLRVTRSVILRNVYPADISNGAEFSDSSPTGSMALDALSAISAVR